MIGAGGGPDHPFRAELAAIDGRSSLSGHSQFPKGIIMFTQIRVAAIRLSVVAVLLVTAAVAAGWKWNRLPLQ